MKIRWYHIYSIVLPLQVIGLFYLMFFPHWINKLPFHFFLLSSVGGSLTAILTMQKNFHPEKKAYGPLIRNLILFEVPINFIFILRAKGDWKLDFTAAPEGLGMVLIFSFFSYLCAIILMSIFFYRQGIYCKLEGKSEKEIKESLRNLGYIISDSKKNIRRLKILGKFLMLFSIISSMTIYLTYRNISWLAIILLTMHLMLLLFWDFQLSISNENDRFTAEGIKQDFFLRKGEIKYFLLFITIIAFAGLVFSGSSALLPWQWLIQCLNWFLTLFQKSAGQENTSPAIPDFSSTYQPNLPFMEPLPFKEQGSREPYHLPENVKRILLIVVFCLLAMGFLFFMIYPLLKFIKNPQKKRERKKISLKTRISMWLVQLAHWFKKPTSSDSLKISWKERKDVREEKKWIKPAKKREDIKNRKLMVHQFLRLCSWGRKQNIPFTSGMGPEEYCSLLALSFPREEETFLKYGLIFQEYFYSPVKPDKQRIDQLNSWLKGLEKRRNK